MFCVLFLLACFDSAMPWLRGARGRVVLYTVLENFSDKGCSCSIQSVRYRGQAVENGLGRGSALGAFKICMWNAA